MKKINLFVSMTSILMLFFSSVSAQEEGEKDVIFRLSLLTPGIGAEFRIKNNFTALAFAW
jgi:hypothetical protein